MRNILQGRRFFLVSDNMWTEDCNQWNELKDLLESEAAEGSAVLVTTQCESGVNVRHIMIRKWMALGLLHPINEVEELEDVGNRYFDELLSRPFFQDPMLDWQGVVWKCKMHDLVHDLAASVAGDEQAVVNDEKQLKNTTRGRYISWSEKELLGKEFPKEPLLEAAGRVRSFTFRYKIEGQISNSFLSGHISSFKCL
ncbi:hypothetical protein Ancab_031113 [Ancistrocladus abbreviatus]